MKKGIYVGCFPSVLPLEERFILAAEAGFDGIEVIAEEELIHSEAKLQAMLALSRRTLPISSVMATTGWQPSLSSPDPDERAHTLDLLRLTIRAARTLDSDAVLVIPAVVNDRVSYTSAWERGQAALRALVRTAEDFGVYLCVENVWNKFLLSPLEMCRFIDEIDHPRVVAYFDVGNVLAFGYPEQWIEVLAKRIHKVHVKDFRTEVGNITGFVQLLQGDVNWPSVMGALRHVGYDGYLTAETAPNQYLARKGIMDLSSSIGAIIDL